MQAGTDTNNNVIALLYNEEEYIVPECKYTNADAGQCCFYLNGTDLASLKIIFH